MATNKNIKECGKFCIFQFWKFVVSNKTNFIRVSQYINCVSAY